MFNYAKPGKGVRKDEPKGSRFTYFWKLLIRKFWRLCQLNLLYMLFSMPVVALAYATITMTNGGLFFVALALAGALIAYGPANAAFTYVLRNMANEQPVFMLSDFWDAFKANWKQSFVYSLLMAVISFVLVTAVQFYNMNTELHSWMFIPAGLCIFFGLIIVLMSFYVNLMIVTLNLPLKAIIKNAGILAVLCLKTNILTLLFTGLIVLATALFFPPSLIVVVFVVPAWVGFIVCYNSYPGIRKYAIDPFLEQQEAQQSIANQTDTLFEDNEPQKK
jgi:uncharacterized membrane protein YesL